MIIESFPVGSLACNCVVLGDPASREAIVIDPGDEPEKIAEVLDHHHLTPTHVLHTHAHIDHIMAADHLRRLHGAQVCLHPGDRFLWDAVPMQGSFLGIRAAPLEAVDRDLKHGDRFSFGPHQIEVIETPGHTPGSVCLLLGADEKNAAHAHPVLFSGDTLFARGIGRTDLWGGSHEGILTSIRDRLFTLDEETVVHPGHGPDTMIRDEKRKNPFLSEIARLPGS